MRRNFTADQVPHNNAFGMPINHYKVEHFGARKHFNRAEANLARQRLVSTQQQLLTSLPARVERSRNLRATKRPIVQQAAIFPRKRHALRHALVDDIHAHLRKPIHICLARAEIATLDSIVEKPVNRIAVIRIILSRIDATLRCNAVRSARAILETKAFDLVTQFRKRCCRGRTRQPAAHNYHVELPFVRRIDELQIKFVLVPLLRYRPGRHFGIERHITSPPFRNHREWQSVWKYSPRKSTRRLPALPCRDRGHKPYSSTRAIETWRSHHGSGANKAIQLRQCKTPKPRRCRTRPPSS